MIEVRDKLKILMDGEVRESRMRDSNDADIVFVVDEIDDHEVGLLEVLSHDFQNFFTGSKTKVETKAENGKRRQYPIKTLEHKFEITHSNEKVTKHKFNVSVYPATGNKCSRCQKYTVSKNDGDFCKECLKSLIMA